MVNTCVVSGCKQESYPGCGISFHRIPVDKEWRALWITAMNLDSNVKKTACVCSLHFTDDEYLTGAKKKLKQQAVPSVLPKIVPESKTNPVVDTKNFKVVPSVHSSSFSDVTRVGNFCECGGPSSKCGHVEISDEPPNNKIKKVDSSTQTQEITRSTRKVKLQRDIKVLKQKLKRRDIKIEKLKSILHVIKNEIIILSCL